MSHYDYGCVQEVICNENNVYPAMKDLVEVHHMSVKGAARFVHEDSGGKVTEERARQVYIRRTKCSIEQSDKPLKKYTKPEAKIQLENVADAIKKGEVADEDMGNDSGPDVSDAPEEFRQLWKNILAVSEGLQKWADGEMKPDTEGDAIAVKGIMAALPFTGLQIARMGVDLVGIHKIYCLREKQK
jgi:hypothetical protein